jgi:TonB family protein
VAHALPTIPDVLAPLLPSTLPTMTGLVRELRLHSGPATSLEALATDGGIEPDSALAAETVDEPVRVLDQSPPRYPTAMATAGAVGRVELSYVVDTLGRAEPGSLRTLASSHPAFESAARASVLATRYRPARWHGRPVRQLVRQALTFRLGQ